jgi:hypothetical protein
MRRRQHGDIVVTMRGAELGGPVLKGDGDTSFRHWEAKSFVPATVVASIAIRVEGFSGLGTAVLARGVRGMSFGGHVTKEMMVVQGQERPVKVKRGLTV